MEWLYSQKGFSADLMKEQPVADLVNETYRVLSDGVNSSITQEVPKELTNNLRENTFRFSGFKTYHQMKEASLLLEDKNGGFKSYESFQRDVLSIDNRYNRQYLEAEYNFAVQSTQMAVKWKEFGKDGNDYNLQYRTANDGRVREEHAVLHGTTLPVDDPFWDKYYPPLGWNCRCTVVQVRKNKYDISNSQEAIAAGERATAKPKQQIFRFNPGKTKNVFPPKHPYMPKGCGNCEYKLARDISSQQCQACVAIHKCWLEKQRSESSRERFHYMQEMSHLEKTKVIINGNGHPMSVGFSRKRNAHLYADTFGRTQVVKKEDLKNLDKLLENATFIAKAKLYKQRKDNIKRFYYYEAQIQGSKVYLNVAEEDFIDGNGQVKHQRYLYSITDKIKNKD